MEERCFAVCVLFVGLVVFSSILGSVTALVSQSKNRAYQRMREGDQLKKFFLERRVSFELGNRIIHFFSDLRAMKTRVHEADIPLLQKLPTSMLMELHTEVYTPVLANHQMLGYLGETQVTTTED